MDYNDILLKKHARELQIKLRTMGDNIFNIYKDRLVEINTILTDNSCRENLRSKTVTNLKNIIENDNSFHDRRLDVFYFIYNLNRDVL